MRVTHARQIVSDCLRVAYNKFHNCGQVVLMGGLWALFSNSHYDAGKQEPLGILLNYESLLI
jgi:hypothetical protein